MKQNTTKKFYDITFDESHCWKGDRLAKNVVKHATSKDEVKNIIDKRLKESNHTDQYIPTLYRVHSIKIESHDLIDINGRTFISQDTKDLGDYTVLYPYQKLDQKYAAYAPDRNVIDLNLNLLQKAKQR